MSFKPLFFAVVVASYRELFQLPIPARQQAFLQRAQPTVVSRSAYTPTAVWIEPRYSPALVHSEAPEHALSLPWFGMGAIAAATVSGVAINRALVKKPRRPIVAGRLLPGPVARGSSPTREGLAVIAGHAAVAEEKELSALGSMGESRTTAAYFDGDASARIRESIERSKLGRGLPVYASSGRHAAVRMVDNPYDAVASPLRKFEGAGAAPTDIVKDLPIEVIGLFAVIVLVGIAGLVKSSGGLPANAPTLGLGDKREDVVVSDEVKELLAEKTPATTAEGKAEEQEESMVEAWKQARLATRGYSDSRPKKRKKGKK
jgi:hypothetical protein